MLQKYHNLTLSFKHWILEVIGFFFLPIMVEQCEVRIKTYKLKNLIMCLSFRDCYCTLYPAAVAKAINSLAVYPQS